MKIIITEQQSSLILDKLKNVIQMVLSQQGIYIKDLDIVQSFFPKRGLKIILKLEDKSKKAVARELINDLLGNVVSFGDERKFSFTESELVGLIKRSLNEQTILNPKPPATPETLIPGMTRKGVLEKIWCSLQFGKITAQVPNWKGKQWCSKGGFRETFKVTEDEDYDLYKKCPVYSTPELQNKKEGWTEIYNFFDSAKDGFKRESNVEQYTCDNYYSFDGKTNKGASVRIYSDGDLNYTPKQGRGLQGTWSWDGTKPVFNLPFTKKAVGYAQTEEDITQNKKILNVGSRGDLVKRIQYEILSDTD